MCIELEDADSATLFKYLRKYRRKLSPRFVKDKKNPQPVKTRVLKARENPNALHSVALQRGVQFFL
jgi:hypothetical protein